MYLSVSFLVKKNDETKVGNRFSSNRVEMCKLFVSNLVNRTGLFLFQGFEIHADGQQDCGVDLYADFSNNDAENLDKLASSLQNPGQESTNNASNTPRDSSNTPIDEKPEHSLPTGAKAIQISFDTSTTYDEHAVASSSGHFQSGDRRARFLALCVNTGAIYKTLAEIETSSLRSDAVAFSMLKNEYLRTRGLYSRFSFLVKPITIEFIQVRHLFILVGMCHC